MALHVTVIPQLRGPNLGVARFTPDAGYGTSPAKPVAPRPPLPEQHATRRPLAHDLDAWYAAAESAMGGAA